MCYQRPNHNSNTNNHGNEKPTHVPHSPFGHKWTEPYFDLQMPRNVTSLVGKSAYLGCRVRNLGNKTVAWIRHRDLHILTVGTYTYTTDQRFQTSFHRDIDEWTLQIKWAQKRDAGAYECQISTQPVRAFSVNLNIVDSILSDTDNLLQQYYSDDAFYINTDRFYQRGEDEFAGLFPMKTIAVPTATILGGPDLYVDKGSTINLTCAIKFSPEPPTHIFWYHQDKVLSEDSERGGISFVTSREDSSKSILLIENADLPDSGKYSCYPSNTEIASIRVHVLNGERPEAMQTSGASRNTLIGYQPSFIKLPPALATISTILATTTIIYIVMVTILTKFGWILFHYFMCNTNCNMINASTTVATSLSSVITKESNDIRKDIRDEFNSKKNNCIITTKDNELDYGSHIIIYNNKTSLIINNKFKDYCRKIHRHHHHPQHHHQRYHYNFQHNYYGCHSNNNLNYHRQQQQQQLQQIDYDEEKNSCHSCSYCSNCYCYNSSTTKFSDSNTANSIHYQHQQQHENHNNNICNNNEDVFEKVVTNFSQLRTNYHLKSSSFHNMLCKNYCPDEMNCRFHYNSCSYFRCNCFNEKSISLLHRHQQLLLRYLER